MSWHSNPISVSSSKKPKSNANTTVVAMSTSTMGETNGKQLSPLPTEGIQIPCNMYGQCKASWYLGSYGSRYRSCYFCSQMKGQAGPQVPVTQFVKSYGLRAHWEATGSLPSHLLRLVSLVIHQAVTRTESQRPGIRPGTRWQVR